MHRRLSLAGVAAVLAGAPQEGRAGGFFVPGAGPPAQARAGAFTAKADDPSALSHNPAGMAKLDGTHFYLGVNLLEFNGTYLRDGRYETSVEGEEYEGREFLEIEDESRPSFGLFGAQALPTLGLVTDFGQPQWPVRFSVGMASVQAYPSRTTAERVVYDDGVEAPAPQRYDIIEQTIVLGYPSAAVSYSPVSSLAIGARASWGFANVRGKKAVWSLVNYEESPQRESVFTLNETKDNFIPVFGFGALFRATRWLEVGASYVTSATIEATGTGSSRIAGSALGSEIEVIPVEDAFAKCAPGGKAGRLKACVYAKQPDYGTLGARLIRRNGAGREIGDIELDVRLERWSNADATVIQVDGQDSITERPLNSISNPHGYQDVISTRLGGQHSLDAGFATLILRLGVAYDTATAPKSWTRFDQDGKRRATFAGGIAIERGRYRLDIGGGTVWEPTLTVANDCRPPDGPTNEDRGCDGAEQTPVDERDRPDPLQPILPRNLQRESPFNAGRYESGYWMLSTGISVQLF